MRRSIIFIFCWILLFIQQAVYAQADPFFWRGVYLFGIGTPSDARAFFDSLSDGLKMNVIQVRLSSSNPARTDLFLRNNGKLRILAENTFLDVQCEQKSLPTARRAQIASEARRISVGYTSQLRFYLRDEPDPSMYSSWNFVRKVIYDSLSHQNISARRKGCVTATAYSSTGIEQYLTACYPSELIFDPYCITAELPHPSLPHGDLNSGIPAWDYDLYLWRFNKLRLENTIVQKYIPAADAAKKMGIPLIIAPQLHGVLLKATKKYTDPNGLGLRPPSPSEIRLQYNLGIAYGAKGIVSFIYGYEPGDLLRAETYPGLVSHASTLVDHKNNTEVVYDAIPVWTGFAEKWDEVLRQNIRLINLGDSLISMDWIGAKGWSTDSNGKPITHQSQGWDNIVTSVTTSVPYGDSTRKLNDNCATSPDFAEIGHLMKDSTDYIVVVNRRCANTDTVTISLRLARTVRLRVTNIENPGFYWIVNGGESFSDTYGPGEGRIYRLASE